MVQRKFISNKRNIQFFDADAGAYNNADTKIMMLPNCPIGGFLQAMI